jgi:hypothetical protein
LVAVRLPSPFALLRFRIKEVCLDTKSIKDAPVLFGREKARAYIPQRARLLDYFRVCRLDCYHMISLEAAFCTEHGFIYLTVPKFLLSDLSAQFMKDFNRDKRSTRAYRHDIKMQPGRETETCTGVFPPLS